MKNKVTFSFALALGFFAVSQFNVAQAQNKPTKSSQPVSHPASFTGIVSGAPQNGEINLRVNGQVWRVKPASKAVLANIRGGDQVRAFGRPLGRFVYNAQLRVLRRSASTLPDDYLPRRSQ